MGEDVPRARSGAFWLALASIGLVGALAALLRLKVDLTGFGHAALLGAFILSIGMLLKTGPLRAVGDTCMMLGLLVILTFSGGAIAIMSTRSPAPLADGWLGAADRLLGLPTTDLIGLVSYAPTWVHEVLKTSYEATGLWLILTMFVMPWIGMTGRAWRMTLLWVGTFIATTLIAFAAPAYGSFSQIDPEVAARLPQNAGRFAFDTFSEFRFAKDPILSISSLGAVICFPSFHTICALLFAQAWFEVRGMRLIMMTIAGAVIISTIPIGGHYFVDLPAGFLVWWLCSKVADRWLTRGRSQESEFDLPVIENSGAAAPA